MIVIRRLVALALALIAFGSPASPRLAAAANESTTFVLHAIDGGPANGCATPGEAGFDCASVPAAVAIAAGARADIYLFLRNHDEVSSLVCAFTWPAAWSYLGWAGGCQPGQVEATVPSAPGPVTGTLIASFSCATGGLLAPIGFLRFDAGAEGCLDIIEAAPPGLTGVSSCTGAPTRVSASHRGRVCVGPGGVDVCAPAPVSAATWGRIKATYGGGG